MYLAAVLPVFTFIRFMHGQTAFACNQPVFSVLAYILLSGLLIDDNTKWAAAVMDLLEQT